MTAQGPRLEIDGVADAAYIRLSDQPVSTTEQITDLVLVDLDAMRFVVGIEVLTLSADLPFEELTVNYHVHTKVIDLLRKIRPSVAAFVVSSATDSTSAHTIRGQRSVLALASRR